MNNEDLILNFDTCNSFDLILGDDSKLDFNKGSLNREFITDDLLFYYDFMVYQSTDNIYSLINDDIIISTGITVHTMSLNIDNSLNFKVLNTSGGSIAVNYIPERNKEGFTLNFLINKETGTTENMFFEMGTSLVNGINFSYTGDYVGFTEILNKKDCSGNTVTQTVSSGTPVVSHTNPWINLTITYQRDQDLEFCKGIQNWIPTPKIITVYDEPFPCSGHTGFTNNLLTGDTGYFIYSGGTYNPFDYDYPLDFWTSGYTGHTYDINNFSHTGWTGHTKFTPSGYTCESPIPSTQIGMLEFFINGRPVFETRIQEPVLSYYDTGFTIATNFNGGIGMAMMYTRPLSIPEIISNYYTIANIYNITETFGGPKLIVSSDLTNI